MADWDADSPELRQNIRDLLVVARESAGRGDVPSVEQFRDWHNLLLRGLTPDNPDAQIGAYRGEPGLETYEIGVPRGSLILPGIEARRVADELGAFESRVRTAIARLDGFAEEGLPSDDFINAVLTLAAFAHGEWVRIHPFCNGNGRTARLWANVITWRFGLPALLDLRPRPEFPYGPLAADAMLGNWQSMVPFLVRRLEERAR